MFQEKKERKKWVSIIGTTWFTKQQNQWCVLIKALPFSRQSSNSLFHQSRPYPSREFFWNILNKLPPTTWRGLLVALRWQDGGTANISAIVATQLQSFNITKAVGGTNIQRSPSHRKPTGPTVSLQLTTIIIYYCSLFIINTSKSWENKESIQKCKNPCQK